MPNNYFKPILSLLTLLFLFSCDQEGPVEVSSGIAQDKQEEETSEVIQAPAIVFKKTCQSGSLEITKQTETTSDAPTPVIAIDELPVGAEVKVSGKVNDGSVCGFTGSVSFSCQATVKINLNKAFSCMSENVVRGKNSYSGSDHKRTLNSGDFIVYYGATKSFTRLKVNSSSPLVPAECLLSFTCE